MHIRDLSGQEEHKHGTEETHNPCLFLQSLLASRLCSLFQVANFDGIS